MGRNLGGILAATMARLRRDPPSRVTREHVIWAYRLFLDREPENEQAVAHHVDAWHTTKDLRANFLSSMEFRRNSPDLAYMSESNVVIKEIDQGLRLFIDLSDYVIGLGILRGHYERSELEFVRRSIKPGQTVLDVGAHIGLFATTMAGLVGPAGQVYAFEPLERNAELLERSISENGFGDRVVLERAAVSDTMGSGQLVSSRDTINLGGAFLLGHDMELLGSLAADPVRLIALDAYPLRRPVSFIKMDIEGAEPLALRGARELLQTDRPIILSELHPAQLRRVAGCTPADVIAQMQRYGYECRVLQAGSLRDKIIGDSISDIATVVFLPQNGKSE